MCKKIKRIQFYYGLNRKKQGLKSEIEAPKNYTEYKEKNRMTRTCILQMKKN